MQSMAMQSILKISFAILFWGIIIYIFFIKRSRCEFNDDFFKQAGVFVDFKKGTMTIKNHTFNVSDIVRLKVRYGTFPFGNSAAVTIETNNFSKPLHKAWILTSGEEFYSRLKIVIPKAGGPDFQ